MIITIFSKWLKSSIWPIDRTLTSTALGQGGPKTNGNKGVLQISENQELEPHHPMQFSVIHQTVSSLAIKH